MGTTAQDWVPIIERKDAEIATLQAERARLVDSLQAIQLKAGELQRQALSALTAIGVEPEQPRRPGWGQ
jgi:hypothetical protein